MIAFTADSANLSGVDVEFNLSGEISAESFEDRYARINRSILTPLLPVSAELSGQYTNPQPGMYRNYSAYIYVASMPDANDNVPGDLTINLHYRLYVTPYGNSAIETHEYFVNETIPAGVSGWIPVTVQKIG